MSKRDFRRHKKKTSPLRLAMMQAFAQLAADGHSVNPELMGPQRVALMLGLVDTRNRGNGH